MVLDETPVSPISGERLKGIRDEAYAHLNKKCVDEWELGDPCILARILSPIANLDDREEHPSIPCPLWHWAVILENVWSIATAMTNLSYLVVFVENEKDELIWSAYRKLYRAALLILEDPEPFECRCTEEGDPDA